MIRPDHQDGFKCPKFVNALDKTKFYKVQIGRRDLSIIWTRPGVWVVSPQEPGAPSVEWIIEHAQMWVKECD